MKYKSCDHYDGKCPCYSCDNNCCGNYSDEEGNAIDTDILCKKAKKYCESGRKTEQIGKAILVMDMPSSCSECSLCDEYDSSGLYCVPGDKYYDGEDITESRATFCPLREIPEKKQGSSTEGMYTNEYCDGWNDCIDEITGN